MSNSTYPYRNLAAEELFMRYVRPGEILLYLWQNDNTVVIGRNQNAWSECALETFSAKNCLLARRLSGGGAVYHDLGNQNFTFIAQDGVYDVSKQSDVICRAVKSFGIEASLTGRNDITVDGRKFSGNAYYSSGSAHYHHGTILLSSDLSRLSGCLTPSKEKLQSKGVASVRSRVVNLCEFSPEISPESMRQALITSFEEVYGCDAEFISESVLDKDEWADLTKQYGSIEWTLGRLSVFDRRFRRKLSFGEVDLNLSVFDGHITDAVMYSDAIDADWVLNVGKTLKGCRFDSASIGKRLSTLPSDKKQTDEFSAFLTSEASLS